MARVDDYNNARQIAIADLKDRSIDTIISNTGLNLNADGTLHVDFIDKNYRITYPDFSFSAVLSDTSSSSEDIPLVEQVLVLHYLQLKKVPRVAGEWIAYREIPGATFYFGPFIKRAVNPLKKVFGQALDRFHDVAMGVNGKKVKDGDAGYEFQILPYLPIRLILWEGDDEFPAEANILFDQSVTQIFLPEDVAWVASLLVYRLIALAK